jgi:hypothetical protein
MYFQTKSILKNNFYYTLKQVRNLFIFTFQIIFLKLLYFEIA